MTDQEQEPWQEPWPEKMYLLHPSIKTFGAMVSNPERREYVRADIIEEVVMERDENDALAAKYMNLAEVLEAKLTKAMEERDFILSNQTYSYLGKDLKRWLARDLEDAKDAAEEKLAKATEALRFYAYVYSGRKARTVLAELGGGK